MQSRRAGAGATALVIALFLALAGPAAAEGQTLTERNIGASLIIETQDTSSICSNCGPNGTPLEIQGCNWEIFVQFGDVAGASSYSVVIKDGDIQRPIGGPPFNDNEEGFPAPAGSHRLGLASGGGPPPCPSDPTENGRWAIVKAVAIFDSTSRIVGKVTKTDGTGIEGAKVSAKGPQSASAVTGPGGAYEMKVKRGTYTVSAKGFCVTRESGCKPSKKVKVGSGPSIADFFRELTLSVTGTIRDEFGRGLHGVRTSLAGPESANATTDAGGRYRLEVGKPGTYELTAVGTNRGPEERYYIVQNGTATDGTAADVTLSEATDSVELDWELNRRLQISLTATTPVRADGFSRTIATVRALTQHGDPAPGVELAIDPPTGAVPRAVVCTTGAGSRPLWPSLLPDGSVSPAGIIPGPDTTTNANGTVTLRVFPGTQPGAFNISGARRSDDARAYTSFFGTIPFAPTDPRPLNSEALARALFQNNVGSTIFGDRSVIFETLALRQENAVDGLSGLDAVPVRATSSGRQGTVFFMRGSPPSHSEGNARVIVPAEGDGAVVLDNSLLARATGDLSMPSLREWAAGEVVAVDAPDGRTFLGWPVPITARSGLGTCLEGVSPGERVIIGAHSPVRILLTDRQGRKLGTDARGKSFSDIPGSAFKQGESSYIVAPDGSYKLSVNGTGSGPVTLETRRGDGASVAQFTARKGTSTTFAVTGGKLPKSFRFGEQRVTSKPGVPLLVKGVPKRLKVGKSQRVKLTITDALGTPVSAAVKLTGAAGSLTGFADAKGRVTIPVRATKKGAVKFTVSAPDRLSFTGTAKAAR